ncbi:MAG: hypothetical protein FJZ38_24470 [Candidatus Rokubacteria bacterium]|nr:hypothetical protein [Candidatus Rokubacteria bacterium]
MITRSKPSPPSSASARSPSGQATTACPSLRSCYLAVVRADEALLAHLKRRADTAFCTTCLVGATSVTFEEAALAHGWLGARAGVRIEVGNCSACGGRRVTLAYLNKTRAEAG